MRTLFILIFIGLVAIGSSAQTKTKIAVLKYRGGGDWYSDLNAVPNMIAFANEHLGTDLDMNFATVEVGAPEIFQYPILHITGHGNIIFSDQEARNLRQYLIGGGFLFIDDDYGLNKFIRPAIKKVFPELEFVELPFSHPIYHTAFDFDSGLPKIHKHEGKPPQGFALIWEGRVMCFYAYESNITDGWEDAAVFNDPPEKRRKALQMGANIIKFAFTQ